MSFGMRRLSRALALSTVGIVVGVSGARAGDPVPAEFQGDWVPADGGCDSSKRFRVTEEKMTLMSGKDSQSYGDIGIALSFFGPEYQGISLVAMPELNSGEPPFNVHFNADEEKGVTKLAIYAEIKGSTNPAVAAIQARAKKLAERFPLNGMALKKCPAQGT